MKNYLLLISITLLVLCMFFASLSDVFLTWANVLNIVLASSTVAILAIGASFVIGSAGLDLSVGSIMVLSTVAAVVLCSVLSLSWPFIIMFSLIIGIMAGSINGFLISFLNIPSFIATLGILSIARGLSFILSDGRPIYGLPESLIFIGQGDIMGIPIPVVVFMIIGLIAHVLLRHTKFGKYTLAIGDNEEAVRNSGINTSKQKIIIYAFSGFLAAIAGVLFMARVNAADPSAGMMYELTAITAAIIGGTSLFGGRASIIGVILGSLVIGVLQNGLTLLNIPSYYQQLAIGLVLIIAVSLGQSRGGINATYKD